MNLQREQNKEMRRMKKELVKARGREDWSEREREKVPKYTKMNKRMYLYL